MLTKTPMSTTTTATQQEQKQETEGTTSLAPVPTAASAPVPPRARSQDDDAGEESELVLFKGDQLRTSAQYRSSVSPFFSLLVFCVFRVY